MQATVRSFDPQTWCGTLLRDDGSQLAFDADAFAAGDLLILRLGQRVSVTTDPDGRVTRVTLVTFP